MLLENACNEDGKTLTAAEVVAVGIANQDDSTASHSLKTKYTAAAKLV